MRLSTPSAALAASTFIVAHEFVPRWDSCAWGLDALLGLPDGARAAILAAGVLVVVLLAWLLPRIDLDAVPNWPTRSVALVAIVLAIFGFLAFTTWPSATGLLGDGQLRVRDLDATRGNSFDFGDWDLGAFTAPMGIWFYAKAHELGPDRSSLVTMNAIAFASGIAYLLLSVLLVRRAGRTLGERLVLGTFLLGSGSMQIFFGYPENYAPLFPLALVFALTGERDARSDGLPWRSALVLSVLLPMHFFTLSLAPALLVLGLRSRRPMVYAPLSLGIAIAVAVLWLVAIRFPLSATIGQSDIAKSLPWFGAPDRSQAYRMLDFAHARDLLNLALLVSPGALLSLAFWRRRTFETLDGFFAAAALFPIAAVCVANPTIGAFRDWDVLSWGLLPLGWFVARNTRAASALILGTAGIWHAAVWVALNADPARSEVRFERLLESCPVSTRGASYGWEDVARRHVDAGRYGAAAQATLRATEAAPGNARLWLNAGELMRVSGDPERARECLERSRAILPEWAEPTHLLALLYAESGQWDPAITEFRHTLELDPFAHEARYELGLAYLRNAQPDSAREAFLRFREEFPNSAAVHLQLGEVERVVGDTATARVNYERAVALDPTGEIGQRARARLGIAPPQDRGSPAR